MSNLPTSVPAQVLALAPEHIEVANVYLECQSIDATALRLNISKDLVIDLLARDDVKRYIDSVFLDLGFNNRFRLRNLLDTVIKQKLEEMDAAGVGSSKDISELIALSHKMTMDLLAREIELEKLRQKNPRINNQLNVQINAPGGAYGSLLERIISNANSRTSS